ncbi:MAG TPA: hypothetical protein VMJ75_09535 [Candidatus Acidoferrales bacterium]|nr:hypothetical protein [Candidatus Acidoferrales bacterium]
MWAPLVRAINPPVCSLATFHSDRQVPLETDLAGLGPGRERLDSDGGAVIRWAG